MNKHRVSTLPSPRASRVDASACAGVLAILILSAGLRLAGQQPGSPTNQGTWTVPNSNYINPALVPGPVRNYVAAFGDRLTTAGKERTTLSGTFTDSNGSGPARLVWEAPGQMRLDRTNQPTLIYNDTTGLMNASSISTADASIFESLFDDSPQSFLYGFPRGSAHRLLGTGFRADDGTALNYQGPWYDVYLAGAPALAQPAHPSRQKTFYFDSTTKLLTKVEYALSGSVSVETDYSNWTTTSGQAFPGQIVGHENGSVIFTFTITQAVVGAAASDGTFTGP
jgi:hypothetical protein